MKEKWVQIGIFKFKNPQIVHFNKCYRDSSKDGTLELYYEEVDKADDINIE